MRDDASSGADVSALRPYRYGPWIEQRRIALGAGRVALGLLLIAIGVGFAAGGCYLLGQVTDYLTASRFPRLAPLLRIATAAVMLTIFAGHWGATMSRRSLIEVSLPNRTFSIPRRCTWRRIDQIVWGLWWPLTLPMPLRIALFPIFLAPALFKAGWVLMRRAWSSLDVPVEAAASTLFLTHSSPEGVEVGDLIRRIPDQPMETLLPGLLDLGCFKFFSGETPQIQLDPAVRPQLDAWLNQYERKESQPVFRPGGAGHSSASARRPW